MAGDSIDLIHELAAQGCPVGIRVEISESGNKRTRIQERRLDELEADFQSRLLPGLTQWAAGRWGLFRQNEPPEAAEYLRWDEADDLEQKAKQIQSYGRSSASRIRWSSDFWTIAHSMERTFPPALARAFLDEIAGV